MKRRTSQDAFTLIELIIVVAIIAILASAIFVAVDPARRLHESRNARRYSDVNTILEAVIKYQTDHDGDHYTTIQAMSAGQHYMIGKCTSGASGNCTQKSVLSSCVSLANIGARYLGTVPEDPRSGTEQLTDYYISIASDETVTVGACEPEGEGSGGTGDSPDIELSR